MTFFQAEVYSGLVPPVSIGVNTDLFTGVGPTNDDFWAEGHQKFTTTTTTKPEILSRNSCTKTVRINFWGASIFVDVVSSFS